MPFTITAAQADIPDGTYKGTLEKVEDSEGTFNGITSSIWKWHFLLDVAGTLMPISATSSQNTGPKTKTYEWLTAILGRAPQTGEVIDDPIGKMVLVTVAHVDHNGKESQFPKIKQLTQYVEAAQVEAGIPR